MHTTCLLLAQDTQVKIVRVSDLLVIIVQRIFFINWVFILVSWRNYIPHKICMASNDQLDFYMGVAIIKWWFCIQLQHTGNASCLLGDTISIARNLPRPDLWPLWVKDGGVRTQGVLPNEAPEGVQALKLSRCTATSKYWKRNESVHDYELFHPFSPFEDSSLFERKSTVSGGFKYNFYFHLNPWGFMIQFDDGAYFWNGWEKSTNHKYI